MIVKVVQVIRDPYASLHVATRCCTSLHVVSDTSSVTHSTETLKIPNVSVIIHPPPTTHHPPLTTHHSIL